MGRLQRFLLHYHALLLFFLLEIFCLYLVGQQDTKLGRQLFRMHGDLVAQFAAYHNNLYQYTALYTLNHEVMAENKQLKERLLQQAQLNRRHTAGYDYRENVQGSYVSHSASSTEDDAPQNAVPTTRTVSHSLTLIPALVVHNDVFHMHNFLTLNKGHRDGIRPGMGVINKAGVVGKIRYVSDAFSTAYSLLHTNFFVSVVLKKNGVMGSVLWNGVSPRHTKLLHIPKHIILQKGDLVVTSGYGKMFSRGVLVGHVSQFSTFEEDATHEVTLLLSVDFQSLFNAYVIKDNTRKEQEVLEQRTMQGLDLKKVPRGD